jgi:TldD protein
MTSRRDFLWQGGTAFGGALLAGSGLAGIPRLLTAAPAPDWRTLETFEDIANVRALMDAALNAATMAGASYADVRCSRQRQNFVFTREQQIQFRRMGGSRWLQQLLAQALKERDA